MPIFTWNVQEKPTNKSIRTRIDANNAHYFQYPAAAMRQWSWKLEIVVEMVVCRIQGRGYKQINIYNKHEFVCTYVWHRTGFFIYTNNKTNDRYIGWMMTIVQRNGPRIESNNNSANVLCQSRIIWMRSQLQSTTNMEILTIQTILIDKLIDWE